MTQEPAGLEAWPSTGLEARGEPSGFAAGGPAPVPQPDGAPQDPAAPASSSAAAVWPAAPSSVDGLDALQAQGSSVVSELTNGSATTTSKLRRMQQKGDQLRKVFRLPPDEVGGGCGGRRATCALGAGSHLQLTFLPPPPGCLLCSAW